MWIILINCRKNEVRGDATATQLGRAKFWNGWRDWLSATAVGR